MNAREQDGRQLTNVARAQITIFYAPAGRAVGKRYVEIDGRPTKVRVGTLVDRFESRNVCPRELAELINNMDGTSFLSAGTPRDGSTSGPIRLKDTAGPELARSKDDFVSPCGPGWSLLDHDVRPETPAHLCLDQAQFIVAFKKAQGINLWNYGCVRYPSSGSYIASANGSVNTGLKGHHMQVSVVDASDSRRALKVVHRRFVIAGYGWSFVTDSGAQLVRSPVDDSVADSPNRPIFTKAQLGAGLQYTADRKVSLRDGPPIDTRAAFPDLTSEEEAEYDRIVAELHAGTAALAAERRAARAARRKETVKRNALAHGETEADAERRAILAAVSTARRKCLDPLDEIMLAGGRIVICQDILDAPAEFNGLSVCDPEEPGYDGGRPTGRIYAKEGEPVKITSFAHGGAGDGRPTVYLVHRSAIEDFDIVTDADVLAQIAAIGSQDREVAGVAKQPTAHAPSLNCAYTFPEPFRGPMADAVDALLAVAPKPQPELSTLAALIGMAGAISGRFRLPSGARVNLYGIGVLETGGGKDAPRRLASEIARNAGAKVIGAPASGQGLEDALVDGTSMLSAIDEVGHVLAAATGSRAPSYLIELAGTLLKLYSASVGKYYGRVRASEKPGVPSSPRQFNNPCLSMLGFSTPERLGEALTSANVADGLLGRMLFATGQVGVQQRRPRAQFVLPDSMRSAATTLASDFACADEVCVASGPGVDARLDQLVRELTARADASSFSKALRARSYEKVERVAGVLAIFDNPQKPEMTLEHVEWARALVQSSDAAIEQFSLDYIADGQVQADAQLVRKLITRIVAGEVSTQRPAEEKAQQGGRAAWSHALRASKLDSARFARAIDHLVNLGDVEVVEATFAGKRPTKLLRLL